MRFSLKTVLSGAIGLLALAAAGQGVASVVALSEIEANTIAVSEQALTTQNLAESIGRAVRDARLNLYRIAVASPDAAALDKNQTALTDTLGTLSDLRQAFQSRLTKVSDRALYERFTTAWNAYQNIQLQVVELMIAGDQPGALALVLNPATGAQNDAAVASLTETIASARAQTESNVAETAQQAARAKLIALSATVVGLAVAVAAMLFAVFGIARPIERMTRAMGRLAEGDETVAVPHTGRRDEIGAMAAAVQVFKDNLLRSRALEQETALARAGAETQRRHAVHAMAEVLRGRRRRRAGPGGGRGRRPARRCRGDERHGHPHGGTLDDGGGRRRRRPPCMSARLRRPPRSSAPRSRRSAARSTARPTSPRAPWPGRADRRPGSGA